MIENNKRKLEKEDQNMKTMKLKTLFSELVRENHRQKPSVNEKMNEKDKEKENDKLKKYPYGSAILDALCERGLIRKWGEIVPDFMNRSVLSICYQKNLKPFAEMVLKYLITIPSFDNQHHDILLKSIKNIMNNQETKVLDEVTDFLQLKQLDEDNDDKNDFEGNSISFHRNIN